MSIKLPTIATLGSHSALDICSGAKAQGFSTLVVTQTGREKTYTHYFKSQSETGCVDQTIELAHFKDILNKKIQTQLQKANALFIPNRSFEVYVSNNYDAIENTFKVPMFGNKYLLRMEERTGELTQYSILEKAKIRIPKVFTNSQKIDRLCIVKAQQITRSHERAFFFVSTPAEYEREYERRLKEKLFDPTQPLRIEEYIVGAQVNLNFFYSPITETLELLGTDTRRQTNIAGLTSLPAAHQLLLPATFEVSFEEASHTAVTILESMLEPAFELGERFVTAAKTFHPQGIIGPFSLQAAIIPTEKGKEFVVFDVSPRMPGSPGITATPYSTYRYGHHMSVGERVALEIKHAISKDTLEVITT